LQWLSVAIRASVPLTAVFPGKYLEKLCVMISEYTLLTIRMTVITRRTAEAVARHSLMRVIGSRIRMAGHTIENFSVSRVGVAFCAFAPLVGMGSGENREERRVMIGKTTLLAIWVTIVTARTVKTITGYPLMDIVRLGVRVTCCAIKHFPVSWICMTFDTVIPLIRVRATENREELRIMVGKTPCFSIRMALITTRTVKTITGYALMDIV